MQTIVSYAFLQATVIIIMLINFHITGYIFACAKSDTLTLQNQVGPEEKETRNKNRVWKIRHSSDFI